MRIFSIQNKHLSQVTVHSTSRSTRQEKLTMKREQDRHLLGNEASGRLTAFPSRSRAAFIQAAQGSTGGFDISLKKKKEFIHTQTGDVQRISLTLRLRVTEGSDYHSKKQPMFRNIIKLGYALSMQWTRSGETYRRNVTRKSEF